MKLIYIEKPNETEPELLTEKEFIEFVNSTLIDRSTEGTENDKIEDLGEAIEYAGELGYSIECFEKDLSSIFASIVENKIKEHEDSGYCTNYDMAQAELEKDVQNAFDYSYDCGRYEAFVEILNEVKDGDN